MLTVGQDAPDFTLPQDGGDPITLSDLRGGPVVLFFYPKDDTPGCTKESIAFSGLLDEFKAAGATVIGASRDTVAKHEKFRAKHDLTIPLVSDEDGTLCEAYGTWVEKKMYGKSYMGIERATYLIDAEGKIAEIWRKVKVPGHAEAVLDAVRAL
ncbi:MAG: peroxiredoxin [Pseudomonadota bacterium]|nr:peroxiredoxin [Pseudomonadota bacterium]